MRSLRPLTLCVFAFSVWCAIAAPARAQQLSFHPLCKYLPGYEPAAGVAYEPGVDVNGNPVTGANLNENIKNDIYPIEIPIELDALKLLGLEEDPVLKDAGEADIQAAHITLFEDGHVEYNGRDISESVSYSCLSEDESLKARLEKDMETDLQPAPQPLVSQDSSMGEPIEDMTSTAGQVSEVEAEPLVEPPPAE